MVVNNNHYENHYHDETGINNEDDIDNDHEHENNTTDADEDEKEEKHLHVQPVHTLRRSNHQSVQRSHLDDYILQAEVECGRLLLLIDNEPRC